MFICAELRFSIACMRFLGPFWAYYHFKYKLSNNFVSPAAEHSEQFHLIKTHISYQQLRTPYELLSPVSTIRVVFTSQANGPATAQKKAPLKRQKLFTTVFVGSAENQL